MPAAMREGISEENNDVTPYGRHRGRRRLGKRPCLGIFRRSSMMPDRASVFRNNGSSYRAVGYRHYDALVDQRNRPVEHLMQLPWKAISTYSLRWQVKMPS